MRRNKYDSFDYQKAADWLFDYLCGLAQRGEACPNDDVIRTMHRRLGHPVVGRTSASHMRALCEASRIEVRLVGRNSRQITILVGAYAGKTTQSAKSGNEVIYA